jgi:hypothetical protein
VLYTFWKTDWDEATETFQAVKVPTDAGMQLMSATAPDVLPTCEYIPGGLTISGLIPSRSTNVSARVPYKMIGPCLQLHAVADTNGVYGGPLAEAYLPPTANIGPGMGRYSGQPLDLYRGGVKYGSLQIVDYVGPEVEEEVFYDDPYLATLNLESPPPYHFPSGAFTLTIDLNYERNTNRTYHYMQTDKDAAGREWAPSDVSDPIVVKPGEVNLLSMGTTGPPALGSRLVYRNGRGSKYYLVKENVGAFSSNQWEDTEDNLTEVELPPYGNPTNNSVSSTTGFLYGSAMHPGRFGVTNGTPTSNILYLSEPYKVNVWPEEYQVEFSGGGRTGYRIADFTIVGSTILVFTTWTETVSGASVTFGEVWGLSGYNPAAMTPVLLSSTMPLLSPLSLTRLGETAYWVTYDGLAASSGGPPEIVTGAYTPQDWLAYWTVSSTLTLPNVRAYAGGGCVLLENAASSPTRTMCVDLSERPPIITTYNGTAMTWESKPYRFDQPVKIRWARFTGAGTATLTITNEAGTEYTLSNCTAGQWYALTNPAASATWKFKVTGTPTSVTGVELRELVSKPAGGVIREINQPGELAAWLFQQYEFERPVHLKGMLVTADTTTLYARLSINGAAAQSNYITITNGVAARITPHASDARVCSSLQVEFFSNSSMADDTRADHLVRQMEIFTQEAQLIGDAPAALQNDGAWRGNLVQFSVPGKIAALSMAGSKLEGTLTVYKDGSSAATPTMAAYIKLGRAITNGTLWEIDLAQTAAQAGGVDAIHVYPRVHRLVEGKVIHAVNHFGVLPEWNYTVYEMPGSAQVLTARVKANAVTTMNVYLNGSENYTQQVSIAIGDSDYELSTGAAAARFFEYDFASDAAIEEVHFFLRDVQPAGSPIDTRKRLRHYFQYGETTEIALAQVGLSAYTSSPTLKLNSVTPALALTSSAPIAVPRSYAGSALWLADVNTANELESLSLTPRVIEEIGAGPIHVTTSPGQIARWRYTDWKFTKDAEVVSVLVKASSSVTMRLYKDGATAVSTDIEIGTGFTEIQANDKDSPFTPIGRCSRLGFDFSDNSVVSEVFVFTRQFIPVGLSGLVLRPAAGMRQFCGLTLEFKDTGSFAVLRVVASDYALGEGHLTVTLTPLGGDPVEIEVESGDEIKLPLTLPNARQWDMKIEHAGKIQEVVLTARAAPKLAGGYVELSMMEEPFSLFGQWIVSPTPIAFGYGRVTASAYPVPIRLYSRGVLKWSFDVPDASVFNIPVLRSERQWEVDLDTTGNDGILVYNAALATGRAKLMR